MKEVRVTGTLLKEYSDGELVHYVYELLRTALADEIDDGEISNEAKLAMRLQRAREAAIILRDVDRRMNNIKNDPKIVI